MGITQALFTGVTGLTVNADGMTVIANNLANANAKGFKRDRAEFDDLLSTETVGGNQLGRGSRLREVRTLFEQGAVTVTNNLTDLAIQGQGFFILSNPAADNGQESAGKMFTRVGSFRFDKNGKLADKSGGVVQGYLADDAGKVSSRLTDIHLETNSIAPRSTQTVLLNLNLDSRNAPLEKPFDILDPENSSNFANSISIFDSHGRAHQATIFFRRLEDSADGKAWEWFASVDNREVIDPGDGQFKQFASGKLKFDTQGNLLEEEILDSEINFNGGALAGQKINFDFGQNLGLEAGKGINSSTSISAKSTTNFHTQDGYESGILKSLRVGEDGVVRGVYTNGIQKTLGALAIASFENQDALQKAGGNKFLPTIDSGPAKVGQPETGNRGSLYASALEESNVDIAAEFVNMIMTQRSFQANSRSITTTDTMVEEVVNLKR